jgi:hypothetical protein
MIEITIENGGTPVNDINDPQCTHIVINDQEVKHLPQVIGCEETNIPDLQSNADATCITSPAPTSHSSVVGSRLANNVSLSPFNNIRALIVRAEWFWASIQMCCRASECLYEFTKPTERKSMSNNGMPSSLAPLSAIDPPNKRIKLSVDNLLSHELTINTNSRTTSPYVAKQQQHHTPTSLLALESNLARKSSSNNLSTVNSSVQAPVYDNYDSPTIINSSSIANGASTSAICAAASRPSLTSRNNMSNNNLSTSASLLDATTDDAMSSKFVNYSSFFMNIFSQLFSHNLFTNLPH